MLKIHLNEWRSQTYADIRVWYSEKPGENGAERPSKKGFCINAELLPELRKAVEKAILALDGVGDAQN